MPLKCADLVVQQIFMSIYYVSETVLVSEERPVKKRHTCLLSGLIQVVEANTIRDRVLEIHW